MPQGNLQFRIFVNPETKKLDINELWEIQLEKSQYISVCLQKWRQLEKEFDKKNSMLQSLLAPWSVTTNGAILAVMCQ